MRRVLVRIPALLAVALGLAGCRGADTARQIEELKAQVRSDEEMLRADAETRDPARTDLKAAYVDSAVMAIRPTSNPERPYVGYVRIKWSFSYADGRPLGDAVFDYVYALTADHRWVKADEAPDELAPDVPRSGAKDRDPDVRPPGGRAPASRRPA